MSKKYLATEETHERIADALETLAAKDFGRVIIANAPAFYQRQDKPSVTKTTVTLKNFWVNIGSNGYVTNTVKTIDLTNADSWDDAQYTTAANRVGKDFYIYACEPETGDTPKLMLSANSTNPTGYTAANSRKIGGFHCLCVDVGTISGHTLSGYVAGDILPLSIWDLKHRPVSNPEGMVYIEGLGKWFDIYLASWNGSELVSEYGKTTADGASSPAWHGEKFAEYLGKVGKSLLWRDEFIVAAKGSNEETNILGSADPNTTGGHKDTANRRMISNYGLEDCCGALWQCGRDYFETFPNSTLDQANQMLTGYIASEISVFTATVDSQMYGKCLGLLRRVTMGGRSEDPTNVGSRSLFCNSFSARLQPVYVARGASEMKAS